MLLHHPISTLFPYTTLFRSQNWGNFISVSGLNTGRFLDPQEFTVIHAKGNEENIDRKSTRLNSSHLGISYAVFCLKKKKRQRRATIANCRCTARTPALSEWR